MTRTPIADEWSRAIADWVTQDRLPNERVYLTIDEETLNDIGRERWNLNEGFNEFLEAVREQLRVPKTFNWEEAPHLRTPPAIELPNGPPACTAFLALLVVCAGHYGDVVPNYKGARTGIYFFPWLRHYLGGQPCSSRAGLGQLGDDRSGAPEQACWTAWALYLQRRGHPQVPRSYYIGPMKNVGATLDQTLLTASCRRFLRGLDQGSRSALIRKLRRKAAQRPEDFNLPGATHHLRTLLNKRGDEPQVWEAILSALEGAPAGPRPRSTNIRLFRIRAGEYELRFQAPSRWDRCQIFIAGEKRSRSTRLHPDELKPLSVQFRLNHAEERVDWKPEEWWHFLEDPNRLRVWSSGVPDLYEEHALLIRSTLLPELRIARQAEKCDWDEETAWGEWTDLSSFRLKAPRLALARRDMRVRDRGGVIFEGGVRTGEQDRKVLLFSHRRGSVRAAEMAGMASVSGIELPLSPENPTPLPSTMPEGSHVLEFLGTQVQFELVDWRKVLMRVEAPPDDWLGDAR